MVENNTDKTQGPQDDVGGLKSLGSKETIYPSSPSVSILETFSNKFTNKYIIEFETKEFTSVCPKTGQPDFATIQINYIPEGRCIESKSLKLYLFAYRSQGAFMETIVGNILRDLISVCNPFKMVVVGFFKARGGIKTNVMATYDSSLPEGDQYDCSKTIVRLRESGLM